jgi:hypothetical protein
MVPPPLVYNVWDLYCILFGLSTEADLALNASGELRLVKLLIHGGIKDANIVSKLLEISGCSQEVFVTIQPLNLFS